MNAGDIMSMAGLDDEDVTKGYNNFKTMHKLVDNLAELAHCPKSERTKLLHDRINNISDWHKSNFMKHLGDDKDHCCQCLLCGFHCNQKDTDSSICIPFTFHLRYITFFTHL